jgi:hypothetical protein
MYDYTTLNMIIIVSYRSFEVNPMEEEMCLVDSCTTNSILWEIKYFQNLTKRMRKYFDYRWA